MVIVKDKEKLKRDIILAGFSITSLAKEVGCSKAHISSIVNHERNPSGTIAVKICEQIKGKFDDYFFIESVHKKNKENKIEVRRWKKKTNQMVLVGLH